MKAEDYLRSLLPEFDRERVMEDIRITISELRNTVLPMYKDADKFLGKHQWQNERSKGLAAVFGNIVKIRKGGMISTIYYCLQNMQVNLSEVERIIERTYVEDIATAGLTYRKSQVLQFTEAISFVSRFSLRLLNYLYACETAMFDEQASVDDALTPADIDWVEGSFQHYCNAINAVSLPVKDIEKAINEIPDIVITEENVKHIEATVGNGKTDPLKMGFIPIWLNPIYHIRMAYSEWQTNRYHAAKQQIRCLQLRKSHLESLMNGKPNAKLQKEIDYIEDRIQKYLKSNAEMEKRYG